MGFLWKTDLRVWKQALTLRSKLLFLIFGVACILVVSLIGLGLNAIQHTSVTAQSISRNALESQSKDHMLKVTAENAAHNAQILDQAISKAGVLAAAAGQYFSEPIRYSVIGQLQGSANLQLMPEGHHTENYNERAHVFVPNFVQINNEINQQILVSRVLDPLAFSVMNDSSEIAAVYFISPQNVTRYYSKDDYNPAPNLDITQEIFYTGVLPEVNPKRESQWTSVYDDPAGLGLKVSAIAPIYTNADEFVGVIGIDFRLSDMRQTIEESSLAAGSYSFLIDDSARAIALPEQGYLDLLGQTPHPEEISADLSELKGQSGDVINAMLQGKKNVQRVTDTGVERFIAYTPLGETGWSLGTVVSTETILADVKSMQTALNRDAKEMALWRLVPLALVILIAVTTVGFILANSITRPLRKLTTVAAAIGRGEWDVEIQHSKNDEIGLLSNTFSDMATQLKGLVGSLEARVSERTIELSTALESLESSNKRLSTEIIERQHSEEARADLEARFTHAFQSAPIGLALMNLNGCILNPNPQLEALFWPNYHSDDRPLLSSVVEESERNRFNTFFESVGIETVSDEFSCVAHDGKVHKIVFYLSVVKKSTNHRKNIVLMAQDVTDSRHMTELLQQQANHDELTGLPNRRAFSVALESVVGCTNEGAEAHLLMMDLDQFKTVNDSCGHAEGDRLLVEVSGLISQCVRSTDTVARLGGDEFAVLLVGSDQQIALAIAESIRSAVQQYEFHSENERFRIGVSIGLTGFCEKEANVAEILQLADAACYAAKEAGRNRIEIVSESTNSLNVQRDGMRWVHRLKDAIANNLFVLHGQRIEPLGDITNLPYTEVLLRLWDKNKNQLIMPEDFLPSAERYGLLIDVDKWVVTNLLKNLSETAQPLGKEHRYFVNLTGSSLSEPEFADFLLTKVKNAGLPPGTINFEITETVVIKNIGNARKLIDNLRALGCKIALDDFGTGMSTLHVLRSLNIDFLKIDGNFVKSLATDEVDRLFLRSTIEIAHHLGIKTVAEYIEDDEIKELATSLGADYGQGLGLHQPAVLFMDAEEIDARHTG